MRVKSNRATAEIIKIGRVIDETERFIKKAEAYTRRLEDDSWSVYGCKESAAMKRTSMDLTRALTELRKP